MKRRNLFIASISLTLIFALTIIGVSAATIINADGYSYTDMADNYISVCGWDNRSESVRFPARLNNKMIFEIADNGMRENDFITSVSFNSATYMSRIGISAFRGCDSLTGTLSIPTRITDVGINAFQECISIEEVQYFGSTYSVPEQCFYQCTSLKSVTLINGLKAIDKLAFGNCERLTGIYIPNSVTVISKNAFDGSPNTVIHCYTDSYAHQYALDNGIDYVLIDAPEPTEPPTEAPTDEPTEAPTDEPTSPEPIEVTFILGDADGDGQITILDATKIQRVLADLDFGEDGMIALRGDVNEDGLNIMDATTVQRYIADFAIAVPVGTSVTRLITQ